MTLSGMAMGAVACYGAALSTYLLAAPFIKLRRSIRVRVSLGYITQSNGLGEPMVVVTAINRGQKPATLTAVGLHLPGRGPVLFLRVEGEVLLPHLLACGKTVRFWVPAHRVSAALKESDGSTVRIAGLVSDESDRTYRSWGYRFNKKAYASAVPEQPSAAMAMPVPAMASAPVAQPGESGTAFKW